MANVNLSNPNLYELVNNDNNDNHEEVQNTVPVATTQVTNNAPVPTKTVMSQVTEQPTPVVKVTNKKTPMFKRSLGGFLLFVAIVVVLALCIYFTIYRLGWGVSECMNKNYHNCGVLLTPEVAPLALTGLAALL